MFTENPPLTCIWPVFGWEGLSFYTTTLFSDTSGVESVYVPAFLFTVFINHFAAVSINRFVYWSPYLRDSKVP